MGHLINAVLLVVLLRVATGRTRTTILLVRIDRLPFVFWYEVLGCLSSSLVVLFLLAFFLQLLFILTCLHTLNDRLMSLLLHQLVNCFDLLR